MRTRRSLQVGMLAVLVAAVLPAGASAVGFGPDLNALPANNTPGSTCAAPPPGYYAPVNSPSCMWTYFDTTSSSTLIAPATGTVTAVRVKVGAKTGPMRVNVVRFLYQQTGDTANPSSAGPFLEAYGPQFTPDANAVTTVPVSLPMKEDPTPAPTDRTTIQVIDALALEVQASDVPIPLFSLPSALFYGVYPGPTAGGVTAPSPNALPAYKYAGAGVLMNADLTPADANAPPPAPATSVVPGAGGALVPTVALPRLTIPVKAGSATIPVACQGADCAGLLSLLRQGGGAAGAGKKQAKAVSYGSARFSAKAGATAKVKVKLNRAGRALLKRRAKVVVTARVTFTQGGGKPASFRVTLKR